MTKRRARQLRNNLTPEEVIVWSMLKKLRAEGFHFRRQVPFRDYYLDFACFDRRLVIEVDGAHHHADERQAAHDMVRDNILRRQGFEVLRFGNLQVRRASGVVLGAILEALRARPALRGSRVGQAGASSSNAAARHGDAPP